MADHLRLRTAMIERGGVARWADLTADVGRRSVEAGCRDGVVLRIGHATYVSPGLDEHTAVRARTGGVLSHLSAAVQHGWSLKLQPTSAFVTLRPNARTPDPTWTQPRFFFRHLANEQIVDGVTEPIRTVLDCARDLDFDAALTVADSALRANAVTSDELREAARVVTGPGCRAARRVLLAADGRAANPLESVLRALCLQVAGLSVEPQFSIETPSQWARVDLADPELRIVIEAEGYETHGTRGGSDNDCARYTALVGDGWLVLRFTWTQVMHRSTWVSQQLVRVRDLRTDSTARGKTEPGRRKGW